MNTITFYVWLFLAFFMIHEFEEIFMAEAWWIGNKEKIKALWKKFIPFGLEYAGPYLTASIAIAISWEFLLFFAVSLLCGIFNNYYVWFGMVVFFILHSAILHLRDFIRFKGYTPGIVTSAILFIPLVWLLYQANAILHYGIWEILLSVVLGQVVLYFGLGMGRLHKSLLLWSKLLCKYSKTETPEQPTSEPAS